MEPNQRDTSVTDNFARVGFIGYASDKPRKLVSTAVTRTAIELHAELDVAGVERSRESDQLGDIIVDRLQTADPAWSLVADWHRTATIATPFDKR